MHRRQFLVGAGALAMAPSAWGEPLRGADIAGDIAILRQGYEQLHPGLYRYATQADMSVRFDALSRAWSRDQTRREAYLSLSRFLAGVRCGHTYANFYNQRRAVAGDLFDAQPLLPLHFCWIDGRMVVQRNFTGDAHLAPGAVISAIDGVSTPRILAALLPYTRADGGNDAKRVALLEPRGFDRYESFDLYYALHYQPGASFRLRVRAPGARRMQNVEVAATDLATRRSHMGAGLADDAPAWTLSYPQADTALLTMPDWALYDSGWDWRGFLDAAFEEMAARGVTKLVVDLRGNEGGLDCGEEIVARLIDAPLWAEGYERRVRFRTTPEALNPYLDTWDDSFRSLGAEAEDIGGGFYRLANDGAAAIAPKGPRFRGRVSVLIDAQNSSATFQFAQMIRANGLGRLIGGPTGGNRRGINGGAFFFLRLPASGLEADLPLIGEFPRTPQPDAGLLPDVAIVPSASDFAAGRDPALAAALAD